MGWIRTLQHLGRNAPTIAKLAAIQRAGGPQALTQYLVSGGYAEVGDMFLQPGSTRKLVEGMSAAVGTFMGQQAGGEIIEHEPGAPWDGFVERLPERTWGLTIILGDRGQAKTTLAFKLAQVWMEQHDYRLEVANVYRDDIPAALRPYAVNITSERIIERMRVLGRYLNGVSSSDDAIDDGLTLGDKEEQVTAAQIEKMKRRVTVWDEAGAAFNALADVGQQAARAGATNLAAQIRHLESHVILIAQYMRMIPPSVMAGACQMYKRSARDTAMLDEFGGRQGFARMRWNDVEQAFEDIRRTPWWSPPLNDPRAWALVIDNTEGADGYIGMMPFRRVEDIYQGEG